ncbi:hypothetical protein GCM10027275_04040 [Rhabdobacter roseus]|uniref:TonB C-terminal domain-containing protein n=1 Tax=Rhabdobacter roseus TaxID=1655419 RepID=A0A840TM33_9BACT|nr:energy transducer TonB [Rhabdobacter roseus]MBB5282293.1 hypothetical protein [Rhabdobacter roseus]
MKLYLTFALLLVFSFFTRAQHTSSQTVTHETLPEFPGGAQQFYKYIGKNFKYPKSAVKAAYQGSVEVNFVIDNNGKIKVDSLDFGKMYFNKKNIDNTLEIKAKEETTAELKRVFESSPAWKPAYKDGLPVWVHFKMVYNLYFE